MQSQLSMRAAMASLLLGITAPLTAQDPADAAASRPTMDLVGVATKAGSFKTLLTAAKAAGLVPTLQGDGPLTVFAPTDDAFAKLPEGTVEKLLADKEKLAAILTYHVVPGRVPAASLTKQAWAETVQGQSLMVQTEGDKVMIDGANVVKANIPATNGMIHVIDSVVLPRPDIVDTAVAAGSFGTLVTAVKAAELVDALKGKGPFTVFAPADSAFAKLPEGALEGLLADKTKLASVLTFHVVPGRVLSTDLPIGKTTKAATLQGDKLEITRTEDGVTVNGARVASADIIAGNGVIHVIDSVVLPE